MKWIVLDAGIAATTDAPAPTLATDGVALSPGDLYSSTRVSTVSIGTIRVVSTAGSGAMSISGKLWGYFPAVTTSVGTLPARWAPLGTNDAGDNTLRGMINGGFGIGRQIASVDQVDFVEQCSGWDMAERLAFQCTAIANGTFAVAFGSPDLTED